MKKQMSKLLAFALTIGLLSGCGSTGNTSSSQPKESAPSQEKTAEETTTVESKKEAVNSFVDGAENEITLPEKVEKIAITPIPWASIIWAMDGGSDRIVSINPSSMAQYKKSFMTVLAPQFADVSTEEITQDFSINIEALADLKTDLVFIWNDQTTEAEQLKALGMTPIMLYYAENLSQLRDNIEIVGNALQKQEIAKNLIAYHTKTENYFLDKKDMVAKAEKPKVLYLQNNKLSVAGSTNINQYLLDLTGGINVAADLDKKWNEVNMEQVMAWNPDIIYLSQFDETMPDDLYENKIEGQDWSNIDAVKNKRVYKTPIGILRWDAPCLETPLMMYWMASIQQPELFSDVNFETELREFYHNFLHYDLTDDEVKTITNRR